MSKQAWTHPTHQRVPDEAHARLGSRSKIIHVRLSESEYAALQLAMASSGTHKLSRYIRALLLKECATFLPQALPQSIPFSGAPGGTAAAHSGDGELEEWLRLHTGALTESDLFGAVLDPAEPLVRVLDAPEPLPEPEHPWEAFAAPQRRDPPPLAIEMPPRLKRAPTAEQVARVVNGPVPLDRLRELREMMGDDSMVDPAVLAALALQDKGK